MSAIGSLGPVYAHSASLHGHLCPRQVLGVRMGHAAAELLGLAMPRVDKRLFVLVETDGCFADGVSAATGCWLGRRTLRLLDHGKVAATFVDTGNGRAIRCCPHPGARDRATYYVPRAESRWQAQLVGYQAMPSEELLCMSAVELTISVEDFISQPALRVTCAGCGEEVINGREARLDGRILCRGCAGGEYYRSVEYKTNATVAASHSPSQQPCGRW